MNAEYKVNNSYEKVVELLKLEADSIERAARNLEPAIVERSIEILQKCEGKVIVTGVGKSGVIAQKIAQTMTSTGTVAIFVHPSDALHGSLGIITKGDVLIALSNSGETDEILVLLPALKKREICIISIVGNMDSTLARNSDVVLDASVDRESVSAESRADDFDDGCAFHRRRTGDDFDGSEKSDRRRFCGKSSGGQIGENV